MDAKTPAERFFSAQHPVNATLAARFIGMENNVLTVALSPGRQFVVDERSGETHTGFATLALDTVMGGAVMGSMVNIAPIATAGLTTQHMRRPKLGEKLLCRARCDGIHNDIAHMSGQLVSEETGEILSTATGTFMLGTRARPLGTRV